MVFTDTTEWCEAPHFQSHVSGTLHVQMRKCEAKASARYRRSHPDKRRAALTEEQRLRRNELSRLRRTMPEGGAKARAREKASRQRRAARPAAA